MHKELAAPAPLAQLPEELWLHVLSYVRGLNYLRTYALASKQFLHRFDLVKLERLPFLFPAHASILLMHLCIMNPRTLRGNSNEKVIHILQAYLLRESSGIEQKALAATALQLFYRHTPDFPVANRISRLVDKLAFLLQLNEDNRLLTKSICCLLAKAYMNSALMGRILKSNLCQDEAQGLIIHPTRLFKPYTQLEFDNFIKLLANYKFRTDLFPLVRAVNNASQALSQKQAQVTADLIISKIAQDPISDNLYVSNIRNPDPNNVYSNTFYFALSALGLLANKLTSKQLELAARLGVNYVAPIADYLLSYMQPSDMVMLFAGNSEVEFCRVLVDTIGCEKLIEAYRKIISNRGDLELGFIHIIYIAKKDDPLFLAKFFVELNKNKDLNPTSCLLCMNPLKILEIFLGCNLIHGNLPHMVSHLTKMALTRRTGREVHLAHQHKISRFLETILLIDKVRQADDNSIFAKIDPYDDSDDILSFLRQFTTNRPASRDARAILLTKKFYKIISLSIDTFVSCLSDVQFAAFLAHADASVQERLVFGHYLRTSKLLGDNWDEIDSENIALLYSKSPNSFLLEIDIRLLRKLLRIMCTPTRGGKQDKEAREIFEQNVLTLIERLVGSKHPSIGEIVCEVLDCLSPANVNAIWNLLWKETGIRNPILGSVTLRVKDLPRSSPSFFMSALFSDEKTNRHDSVSSVQNDGSNSQSQESFLKALSQNKEGNVQNIVRCYCFNANTLEKLSELLNDLRMASVKGRISASDIKSCTEIVQWHIQFYSGVIPDSKEDVPVQLLNNEEKELVIAHLKKYIFSGKSFFHTHNANASALISKIKALTLTAEIRTLLEKEINILQLTKQPKDLPTSGYFRALTRALDVLAEMTLKNSFAQASKRKDLAR